MSEDEFEEGAEYGALPFDYYIAVSLFLTCKFISAHAKQDHWPEGLEESPQKWEELVWKYQALSLMDRYVWLLPPPGI
jgi:hypothetical protein